MVFGTAIHPGLDPTVPFLHNGDMELVLVIFLLVVGPLALLFGRDSRIDDVERRRNYHG